MKENIEFVKPEYIEKKSFEIIQNELLAMGKVLPKETDMITRRVIHTSADFDYADSMRYSKDAPKTMAKLIRSGADIVTDTNMALAGINKKEMEKYGGKVHCFMAREDIAQTAKERGVTRATVSMETALKIEKPVIFAIGNAPTALIALYESMESGLKKPDFVIGVPVGFVNVVASKELFLNSDVPYIINAGRKGGSNIAAAIVNAVLYEMRKGNL